MGCLAIFAGGFLILVAISALFSTNETTVTVGPKGERVVTEKRPERRGSKVPMRGDVLTPVPGYPRVCVDSEEGFDEVFRWLGRDHSETLRAMQKYGGEMFGGADELKVLDPGWRKTRVRILRTDRECWVVAELARHQ